MAIKKNNKDKIDVEVNSIFYLEAPVAKNQVIANMKITINGETLEILEVYSKEEIRKKEMQDYFIEFLEVINLVFGDGGKKQDLF